MRVIITGMNGTVAPALAQRLTTDGAEIVRWDRGSVPPDNERAVWEFIRRTRPDWVCHVATGAPEWAEWIARACAAMEVGLLWTSSVSVFGPDQRPPFTVETRPEATDDYGRYKIDCEIRVARANPNAIIPRLAWQIGERPGSNTMTDYLNRTVGVGTKRVEASDAWIPSCAFLDDTAEGIRILMERGTPGIYHLEGNTAGLSMFDLASGINRMLGAGWNVDRMGGPITDNRMSDARVPMGQVARRFVRAG